MLADAQATVTLRAPGRLHLGFLDPAGSLGRRFGSLGLVINGFETEVELSASPCDQVTASGPPECAEVERAAACLHLLRHHSGRREPLHLRLLRVLPAHAGFGSGTQLGPSSFSVESNNHNGYSWSGPVGIELMRSRVA